MVSALCVIPLSLLLLLCGFYQALAANSLETLKQVAIMSGAYSDTSEGEDRIIVTYRPVDIPALNQLYPVLFEKHRSDGTVDRSGLSLYPGDGISEYYNFTDVDEYRSTIRNNLASLTLDDLPPKSTCAGNVSLVDNKVINSENCGSFAYSFIYTCTSETIIVHNNGPHIQSPGIISTKLQYLPLPDSWLVGQTECINPCGY